MNQYNTLYNSEIIIRRDSIKICYYVFTLISLLILFIVFACFYKISATFKVNATLIKDNQTYYLRTYILEKDMSKINNTLLSIENKTYSYKIKSISHEYFLDEKYNKYYEVKLDIKLDKRFIINNNIITIYINLGKTTLLKEAIKLIKEAV